MGAIGAGVITGAGVRLGKTLGTVGKVGCEEGGGTKFGNNCRGKSSAAIQVSSALGVAKSTSRVKPLTHSEKRIGSRLRRQYSSTEGTWESRARSVISTTHRDKSTGRLTLVQAVRALLVAAGVRRLIVTTQRE